MIAAKERCPDEAAAGPHRARRLRVDAERNRLALLDAARAVFAEQGIEAPLEEVARRAGVGIATLYRRFPTRGQLVAAAFVDQVAQYVTVAEQALGDGDPWSGFVRFVEWICAAQANDRGLGDLLSMALPADERIEELAALAKGHVVELVERAKAAGELRPDFVGEDLLLLLIANAGIVRVTGQDAPDASRRMVAMFLDAFHARRPASSFPAAPSSEQMHLAMLRLARDRGCAGTTDDGSDRARTQNLGRRPDASGTSGR